MSHHLTISSQSKIGLGSALATMGALFMVLALLLGWYSLPGPWDFLLGFTTGLLAGLGATLAVAGLVERRHQG